MTTKKLARFLMDEVEDGYAMTLETEDGQVFRVTASEEQLDDIAQEIDEVLGDEDDAAGEDAVRATERQPT